MGVINVKLKLETMEQIFARFEENLILNTLASVFNFSMNLSIKCLVENSHFHVLVGALIEAFD